jgi:hypothetical protein
MHSYANGNGCSHANGNGYGASGWTDITMPPVHWWTVINGPV